MNYKEAIARLESLKRGRGMPKHERMLMILEELGNPHKALRTLHVTGTNGKGSSSAMIDSITRAAGYKTGFFSSPHLFEYTERVRINGEAISKEDFAKYASQVFRVIAKLLTEKPKITPGLFECCTLIACLAFEEAQVDLAVIEAGIGGRRDSSNVMDGLVAVITNVGLDHTEVLGESIAEIAHQKAGIIKPGASVVLSDSSPEVVAEVKKEVALQSASLDLIRPDEIQNQQVEFPKQVFEFRGLKLELPLLGSFQCTNAAAAIAACQALEKHGYPVDEKAIITGIKSVDWPLRLQVLQEKPMIIADGAHNPHGIAAIVEEIHHFGKTGKTILVMGATKNKDCSEMARILKGKVDHIIISQAFYKAAPAEDLAEAFKAIGLEVSCEPVLEKALEQAIALAGDEDIVLITGGLYFASDAAQILNSSSL
jgi:dihydrofolate synthase/folylpolyglutamate synthase